MSMDYIRALKCFVAPAAGLLLLAACAGPGGQPTPESFNAVLASADRHEADRATDVRRRSADMLALVGVRPGMTVLDVSAARGYTTELLARVVGAAGKVYAQNAPRDPNRAPPAQAEGAAAPAASAGAVPAPTLAERARRLPQIMPVTRSFDDPVPSEVASGALDLVTLIFNYHDLGHMGVDRARMNRAIFAALKPGGVYVIADHAGRDGTGISEAGTLHRVEEAFVVQEVQAAGLRLQARGDFLRNPQDPRDRNTPVPAMAKDAFVLRFVKP
jgi:predicted methyltransferase